MNTQERVKVEWDRLQERIAAAAAMPQSVERCALLYRLYRREFEFWQAVFESATRRSAWLAALAAGERARGLARHYESMIDKYSRIDRLVWPISPSCEVGGVNIHQHANVGGVA